MSKWKCGICNNEFDNFQAQGFGGDIYCPLCYFKELYRITKLERDRLKNIINYIWQVFENGSFEDGCDCIKIYDYLKALKENK